MTNPMLADLDAVVRLGNEAYVEGKAYAYQDATVRALNFMLDYHATLADMAKRLEAAERDAGFTTGPELFRFSSFSDWVNHAQGRFAAVRLGSWEYVCIDATGRICNMGKQFMSARDRNAFPVIVYHIDPERTAIDAATQEGEG